MSDQAHIYVLQDSEGHSIEPYLGYLSPDEAQRATRYRAQSAMRCFVWGRVLLRTYLAQRVAFPPQDIPLSYSAQKKPFLPTLPYHISISHSAPYIAIAISSTPIGIDIEWLGRRVRMAHASRFFSPREIQAWETLKDEAHRQYFFSLWTLKEAWWKALDPPYEFDMRSLTFSWHEGLKHTSLQGTFPPHYRPAAWHHGQMRLLPDAHLAWTQASPIPPIVHSVRPEHLI